MGYRVFKNVEEVARVSSRGDYWVNFYYYRINANLAFRLVSVPDIAAEGHVKDPGIVVRARVSVRPLRIPSNVEAEEAEDQDGGMLLIQFYFSFTDWLFLTERVYGLDAMKPYPIITQLNSVLSLLLSHLERNEPYRWTVHCLRRNVSGLGNNLIRKSSGSGRSYSLRDGSYFSLII